MSATARDGVAVDPAYRADSADSATEREASREANREASIDLVIIGLGYVGLPLAFEACRHGLRVAGYDANASVVDGLNAGRSHIDDLDDADIQTMLKAGFTATTDPSVLSLADTVVICVPTPLTVDGSPDLGAVHAAVADVAAHLHPGMLVVLESTTYPGTTDEEVRPMLEATGLVAGRDFHLAFSPERIDPGNPSFGVRNTPKVVGGQTPACTQRATEFYAKFIEQVVPVRSTREAEMAKLLENTYRHVNIALVNEMAKFCHELGIDLWEVIRAAATKPFGFQPFYPGPGVGGHCIPIDPNYLSHQVRAKLGYPFRFVELAQEINAGMPSYVLSRITDALNEDTKPLRGSRVLLLGVTYKANIADQRESPAQPLARQLLDHGARLWYHDPFVPAWHVNGQLVERVDDPLKAAAHADLTVLLAAHRDYDLPAIAEAAQRMLDTRGQLNHPHVERL